MHIKCRRRQLLVSMSGGTVKEVETNEPPKTTITSLPNDILSCITNNLGPADAASLVSTSKSFKECRKLVKNTNHWLIQFMRDILIALSLNASKAQCTLYLAKKDELKVASMTITAAKDMCWINDPDIGSIRNTFITSVQIDIVDWEGATSTIQLDPILNRTEESKQKLCGVDTDYAIGYIMDWFVKDGVVAIASDPKFKAFIDIPTEFENNKYRISSKYATLLDDFGSSHWGLGWELFNRYTSPLSNEMKTRIMSTFSVSNDISDAIKKQIQIYPDAGGDLEHVLDEIRICDFKTRYLNEAEVKLTELIGSLYEVMKSELQFFEDYDGME